MKDGNFIDYVKIHIVSGNGGKGSTHLRREKFVSKGGPDGGDGGRGGHIVIIGNSSLWTLQKYRFQRYFKAEHGGNGGKSRSTGANGSDIFLEVPLGTVVRCTETNEILFEITEHEQKIIAIHGGIGGKGNWHFKSATNQTPRYAQLGKKGKELKITLELKILADVGLVGFPNAGKSTLLSVITDAKPKIENYPFTTLKPNLGIVAYHNYTSFVVADIPGIIEGAAEGKGLGHYFLRHIERNSVLLFIIPSDSENIVKEYQILLNELRKYHEELLDKSRVIAISKCDLLDEELQTEMLLELNKKLEGELFICISSITKMGLTKLKDSLWRVLHE